VKESSYERFQRAIDSSMIISLAKLLLFSRCWALVRQQLDKIGPKDTENTRIALRERINHLPSDLFFMPPEFAGSEHQVQQYFENKFQGDGLQKIIDGLVSRTRSTDPELSTYLKQTRKLKHSG
jgi:hypothetical protein